MGLFDKFKKNTNTFVENGLNINPFKMIGNDDIVEFEKRMGINLPEEYKKFLLAMNGGYCTIDEDCEIKIKEIDDSVSISSLFGINTGDKNSDIEFWTNKFKDYISQDTIVIGEEICQGYFVMTLDGFNNRVYFWNHDEDDDDWEEGFGEKDKLYLIADSFMEFWTAI